MSKNKLAAITVLPPKRAAIADLATFRLLVIEGGEVNPVTLPKLIEQSLVLAFARMDNLIVG